MWKAHIEQVSSLAIVRRSAPGADQIGSFMQGDQVTLLSQSGNFAKIRIRGTDGQLEGWVLKHCIQTGPDD
ncbi:SH3 domain-containing protein [Roseovarius atlanticus]|uniref:SH3 domain-containing protein n=1 Tax=Roseovarius atlanticus TaxID=1641875 RepID=UPI0038B67722